MLDKRPKAQAALEFLTTYSWAFVVILITLGALYYSGIFNFGQYLPQKCVFPSQFKCLDFSLKPTEVRVKLINNLGENINITSMQITNDAATSVSCTPPLTPPTLIEWLYSTEKEFVFTSCSGGGYLPGERVELKISMSYYAVNTPSKPIHLVNGKINGQVTSS